MPMNYEQLAIDLARAHGRQILSTPAPRPPVPELCPSCLYIRSQAVILINGHCPDCAGLRKAAEGR